MCVCVCVVCGPRAARVLVCVRLRGSALRASQRACLAWVRVSFCVWSACDMCVFCVCSVCVPRVCRVCACARVFSLCGTCVLCVGGVCVFRARGPCAWCVFVVSDLGVCSMRRVCARISVCACVCLSEGLFECAFLLARLHVLWCACMLVCMYVGVYVCWYACHCMYTI